MKLFILKYFTLIAWFILLSGNTGIASEINSEYEKGEYGYDLAFLLNKLNLIELVAGNSRLILAPEYQGRVMSSTSSGMKGYSHGWINYDLIASSKIQEHFNAYGGEERLWLGPEGGQFSVFFEKGVPFDLEHWIVPAAFDTEAFEVVYSDSVSATFEKNIKLKNYSGTTFHAQINRTVTLFDSNSINSLLGIKHDKSISVVAYQSVNRIKNTGDNCWDKSNGALSIWMLSMLKGSHETTVVLPFNKGGKEKIVTNYFGDISENRMKITDNTVFLLADGKFRSKIGISPEKATPYVGSYDSKTHSLTIVEFTLPENTTGYVNSILEIQEEPFRGDAINFYNNGSKEDGLQNNQYYELELSSPAAFLKPGEQINHIQNTFHFTGSEEHLDKLTKSLLNVPIEEIKNAFMKNKK